MIALIVARAKNGVIGREGGIPWHLPDDFAHFREVTRGKTVVMGGRTFQSIIARNGKPLPGRLNVVLTRDTSFSHAGVEVIRQPQEITRYPDSVIIGAFDALLPYADRLYLTEVDAKVEGDARFPDLDESWVETSRRHHDADTDHEYAFDFVTYEKSHIAN